jgi:hypothetical protein
MLGIQWAIFFDCQANLADEGAEKKKNRERTPIDAERESIKIALYSQFP